MCENPPIYAMARNITCDILYAAFGPHAYSAKTEKISIKQSNQKTQSQLKNLETMAPIRKFAVPKPHNTRERARLNSKFAAVLLPSLRLITSYRKKTRPTKRLIYSQPHLATELSIGTEKHQSELRLQNHTSDAAPKKSEETWKQETTPTPAEEQAPDKKRSLIT